MTRHLDDTALLVLYHALGADLSKGLELFEAAFLDAASDYRLGDLDALLDLLADPTLQDERRLAWHHYYAARKALLQWRPQEIEDALKEVEASPRDAPVLQPRLELLRGQAQVMRGEWAAGLATLKRVTGALRSAGETMLVAEAEEWTARAFIGRAQSSGGWAVSRLRGLAAWLRRVLSLVALPLYVPILVYLWVTGAREFWQPTIRYGADHSNWPIFIYYLRAFRALARASQAMSDSDPDGVFRLKIMRAELLRRLPATHAAREAYQELLEPVSEKEVGYQAALLKHGLAQVLLDLSELERSQQLLNEARAAYAELNDDRAVAHIDLLLGDIAIHTRSPEAALPLWESSLSVFEDQQDAVGLAEGLNRCYAVLEGGVPPGVQDQFVALTRGVKRQVFAVRLPNRLFDLLQVLGWAMPILVTLGLMAYAAYFILNAEPADMQRMARFILSLRGVLLVGSVVWAAMALNTLLGLVGLASTLRAEATRLDFFVLDESGLHRHDFSDREQKSLAWSAVTTYLRVERAVWRKPTSTLSFDYLRDTEGNLMRLPGTTAWFGHLQQEVKGHVGQPPQCLRLRWYGGALVGFMGLALALSYAFIEGIIPGFSVTVHAWLASLLLAGAYVGTAFVTGRWILHYIRVGRQVTPASRFVPVVSLLGVCLFGLGAFGRRILFVTNSLAVFWGVVLLLSLTIGLRQSRSGPRWRRPLTTAAGGTVLAVGTWAVLRTLLPILLVIQAFTYARAVHNLDPNQPGYAAARAEFFSHMGQAGKWMVAVDPTFYQGYGYMGYANYYQGDYEASVAAYTQGLRFGSSPFILHCRALAYHALGDETSAQRDWQAYLKYYSPEEVPSCESLFPETSGTFEIP